jgi:hypothetical protein
MTRVYTHVPFLEAEGASLEIWPSGLSLVWTVSSSYRLLGPLASRGVSVKVSNGTMRDGFSVTPS